MLQVSINSGVGTQGPGQHGEACCRSVHKVIASKERHAAGLYSRAWPARRGMLQRYAAGQYSRSWPARRGMLQVSTAGHGQQGEACCRSVQQVLASKERHAAGQ